MKKLTCLLLSVFSMASLNAFSAEKDPNRDNRLETRFVYESRVTIDPDRATVGQSKYGERGIVWITGGDVKGPKIKASVMPGGGDWQLGRPDGVLDLEARYAIKTDDGYIIVVTNKAIIDHRPTKENPDNDYVRSVLSFEAPIDSPYEWMNKSIFLGTVERGPNFKEDPAVIIRVWEVL
ncbi:DUF3237 domain-containing protein [Larsenimonas rhizosphaerae]|uniref:UPF0311 protein OQ287_09325 n=1 Tax=Larsenimonas rhizosphaerae TaxID=2944682 RepID=A0AA41ZGQ3_9GAMM|nr:DUF3237 domain-containing protein [Larsenimonas rhizosphaerae]MCX2524442.1 DUF3237 domain-containing protein [Larsenimonas rhizosphaerae]